MIQINERRDWINERWKFVKLDRNPKGYPCPGGFAIALHSQLLTLSDL
jgi:hypothetical protein